MVANLFGGYKAGTVDTLAIVREIQALEKGEQTGLKPPIQNRHPPLKGLSHKHYMQGNLRWLALNVQNALKQYEIPVFKQKIREAEEAGEVRYLSAEDTPLIVRDAVEGNLQCRSNDRQLTGEWVVLAKHEGRNYYLTMATHDKATHASVRQQIDTVCCREFPFLQELLARYEAQTN